MDGAENTGAQILILIILTLINAFFSCAEMAIVSVNKNKIKMLAENSENKNSIIIDNLLKDPTRFLSTIQVAITLAGFLASASAATSFSDNLVIYLEKFKIPYSKAIAVSVVTCILSYFTLIFGELVPKRLALQNPEKIAQNSILLVMLTSKILSPFVWLLTHSTNLIIKLLGYKIKNPEESISEEEIRIMLELGTVSGNVDEEEQKMINSVFEFNDKKAKEIMVPRVDVFALNLKTPLKNQWETIFEMKFSRIPIYENTLDNIVGVIYLKDLIKEAKNKGFDNVSLENILHKPFFSSENININILFKQLKKRRKYMSIIIDEYGCFSGIITIEDLVEEIVGNIEDEYDDDVDVEQLSDNEYRINGIYSLTDLKNYFGISLPPSESNTISGYITEKIKKVPDEKCEGLRIEENEYSFTIEKVQDNRVISVILKIKN